jgi:hypothetical protein
MQWGFKRRLTVSNLIQTRAGYGHRSLWLGSQQYSAEHAILREKQ